MQVLEELAKVYSAKKDSLCNLISKKYGLGRDVAQDIVQEGFLLAVKKIDNYDPEKGKLKSWIAAITVRAATGHCRKRYWKSSTALDDIPETVLATDHNETASFQRCLCSRVMEDIHKNNDEESKEILDLWLQGTSEREISKRLRVSRHYTRASLDTTLSKARKTYR